MRGPFFMPARGALRPFPGPPGQLSPALRYRSPGRPSSSRGPCSSAPRSCPRARGPLPAMAGPRGSGRGPCNSLRGIDRRGPFALVRGAWCVVRGTWSAGRSPWCSSSRAAARGSRGSRPGPDLGAVYVIPWPCMSSRPGPFVCFRVCHSGACMFVIFRLSRAFSRDNGPRCTALRARQNRAKRRPKNRPLCWLRGRMPNFRQPIGSQRERGYPGRKTGPG
jgi:hypothetical protein